MLTLYDELPEGRYKGFKLADVVERNPYYVRKKLDAGLLLLDEAARRRLREAEAEWAEYEEFWKDRTYTA